MTPEGHEWRFNDAIMQGAGLRYDDLFINGEYSHSWVQVIGPRWEGSAKCGNLRNIQQFPTSQEAKDWVTAQLVAHRME